MGGGFHRLVVVLGLASNALAADPMLRFPGEVSNGEAYQREIGAGVVLRLRPTNTGWTIGIVPKVQCEEYEDWASVVNPPYRGYNDLILDAAYNVKAKQAVALSPRKFSFVLTCEDYKRESGQLAIVLWPYRYSQQAVDNALAKLGTSPQGKATLTIVQSQVSASNDGNDKIDWLKFSVAVSLPASQSGDRNSPRRP